MICVLRVGAVAPGETPPSNTAINREDDEPPRINKQMRRAKLNLAVDLTIKLRSFDEPRMEDLSAVSDWVLMINSGSMSCRRSTWASWTAHGRGWSIYWIGGQGPVRSALHRIEHKGGGGRGGTEAGGHAHARRGLCRPRCHGGLGRKERPSSVNEKCGDM